MAFSLKKFLEGAVAQINPFDGGKTYASVMSADKPAPPPPASTARPQQAQPNLQTAADISRIAGFKPETIGKPTVKPDPAVGGYERQSNPAVGTAQAIAKPFLDWRQSNMDSTLDAFKQPTSFVDPKTGKRVMNEAYTDSLISLTSNFAGGGNAGKVPLNKEVFKSGAKKTVDAPRAAGEAINQHLDTLAPQTAQAGHIGVTTKLASPTVARPQPMAPPPPAQPPVRPASAPLPEPLPQPRVRGQERGFITSVRNSPEVAPEVQDIVIGKYVPKSNRQLEARASARVADGSAASFLDQAMNSGKLKTLDASQADEVVATTIQLAAKKAAEGDVLGSAQLYEQVAGQLTDLGRGVQAASLLARQTPEGQFHQATRAFDHAGVKPSEEVLTALNGATDKMRAAMNTRAEFEAALEKATDPTQRKQIAEAISHAETEVMRSRYEMGQIVSNALPADRMDQVTSLWKAGLLSAPTTLGGAGVGNVAKTTANVARDFLAAGFDQVTSRLVNKGQRSNLFSLGSQGARSSGLKEGVKKGVDFARTGFDERNMVDARDASAAVFKGKNAASWAAKAYTNTVFRPLGVVDQPFFYGELRKSLQEQAELAARKAGVKGAEKSRFVDEFLIDPPKSARARAELEANDATFTNPTMIGRIAVAAKRWAAQSEDPAKAAAGKMLAELVIPFAKIPSAVATAVVNYTPTGAAAEIVTQVLSAKRGAGVDVRSLNRALADSTIGTGGAIFIGSQLYGHGNLTLATPTTDAEKRLWEKEGKKPYSIKIGDRWVSVNYIQPFGSLMAMGAAYSQARKDGQSISGATLASAAAGGQAVTQQSFLKGLSGAITALSQPERSMEQFAENTAGSLVPNFMKRIAAATDTKDGEVVQRDPKGLAQSMQVGIPGLRNNVAPKRDEFGSTLTTGQGPIATIFDPFKASKIKGQDDPVVAEQRRLSDAQQPIAPSKLDKKSKVGGVAVEFSPEQIDAYAQFVGPQIQEAWGKLIASPEYKALDDDKKKNALQSVAQDISAAGKFAIASAAGMGNLEKAADDLSTRQAGLAKGDKVEAEDYLDLKDAKKKNPRKYYEQEVAKFEREKAKMTSAERFKKEQELGRLAITSKHSSEVTELYGMSKAQLNAFFERNPDKKGLYSELVELDNELLGKKWVSSTKYKNGLGSGKKKRKTKLDFAKVMGATNTAAFQNDKALRNLLKGTKITRKRIKR